MLENQIWTNQSVLGLMSDNPGRDPVDIVTDKARKIVLEAIDDGWSGPPFDPIELAERLRIRVLPNDSVLEAQTVPVGSDSFRIEFNPNKSKPRIRYSVAHEIAHTVFADCADEVRQRSSRSGKVSDAWQLETLCNIGAAELLMPLGQLGDISDSSLTIDRVLKLRDKLGVSTEAILIRLIHLAESSLLAFAASYVEAPNGNGGYRLDYAIASRNWAGARPGYGAMLPNETCIRECTAIGFTSNGRERWASNGKLLNVECVGIPPYEWSRLPRVVGIAASTTKTGVAKPLFQIVRGDALEPRGEEPRLVVHVVNNKARTWGGRGFAQSMRAKWPHVHDEFRELAGDREKLRLGKVHLHQADDDIWVADLVAQVGYGPKAAGPRVRYSVLRDCLEIVARKAQAIGASIHMPRIGAGNAGGSWAVIEDIIRTTICEEGIPVTVYDLPAKRVQSNSDQMSLLPFS